MFHARTVHGSVCCTASFYWLVTRSRLNQKISMRGVHCQNVEEAEVQEEPFRDAPAGRGGPGLWSLE